jgi:uncharacterized protein YjbJ (UPF0337 family)
MHHDEMEGKGKQVKGNIKEGVGDLTGNERMRDEGTADRAEGEIQETFGAGKRKASEAADKVSDKLKE